MNSHNTNFDIIVIGAGAVGSGIALDAVLRDYKVIVLEKNDFASGASSKSSKLVHGGVRYLEKAIKNLDKSQLNLVKEALAERAIFLENASNFSNKIKINIPIFSYFNLVKTYIGLFIYKLISFKKNLGENSYLNKVLSSYYFTNLKKENLKGCLGFYDGTFLDFRMVISLLQTASKNGAILKNYCEVIDFLYDENNKISGVKYFNKIENKSYEVKSKVVVNASGANVDNIRKINNNKIEEILALSSGIHIVVSKDFLPLDEGILIPNTSDKRVIFILPYLNYCLIGTTDNSCSYDENIKVKDEEIEYLLKEVNNYFEKPLKKENILSSWSGIRPLIKNENKNTTEDMVREHLILDSKNGLVSIAGGKWTTYRKMAEDLLDFLVEKDYLTKQKESKTKDYELYSNDKNLHDLEKLMAFYPITKDTKESLKTLYGTAFIGILSLANKIDNYELINPNLPYLKVEIEYCIKNEFVKKPIDFLSRRIGLCFVNKKLAIECVDVVCVEMGKIFFWDEKRVENEKIECIENINNYF